MKYIVVNLEGEDQIFVFPRTVNHDQMYESLKVIKFGNYRDWQRKYHKATLVSAGFIENGQCCGKSETLNIKSRPMLDTHLMQVHYRVKN
jgi:hypothetical protein